MFQHLSALQAGMIASIEAASLSQSIPRIELIAQPLTHKARPKRRFFL